jgi:hypothetical protein
MTTLLEYPRTPPHAPRVSHAPHAPRTSHAPWTVHAPHAPRTARRRPGAPRRDAHTDAAGRAHTSSYAGASGHADAPDRADAHRVLARYVDAAGCPREVLAHPAAHGTVLVVDRDAATHDDRRLVAHLAADEPPENALLVCRHYMRDARGRACRPLCVEDLLTAPFRESSARPAPAPTPPSRTAELCDRRGGVHRLQACDAGMSIPELRWCRLAATPEGDRRGAGACEVEPASADADSEPESVRDAVGRLESYEPVRALTLEALVLHGEYPALSVAVLRAELQRLDASRIVLNRGLRRAVLHAMRTEGVSLSEIAFRCGRVKHDGRGNASGETSWLARRVGLAPEGGGNGEPTPWIHTEVLALIARDGLGLGPHEVEL